MDFLHATVMLSRVLLLLFAVIRDVTSYYLFYYAGIYSYFIVTCSVFCNVMTAIVWLYLLYYKLVSSYVFYRIELLPYHCVHLFLLDELMRWCVEYFILLFNCVAGRLDNLIDSQFFVVVFYSMMNGKFLCFRKTCSLECYA